MANISKQTNLKRYVPVPLEQILFYQIRTLITDLCLTLVNYYYTQGLIKKSRAAFDICQKGHFFTKNNFLEKGTLKISPPPIQFVL